MVEDEVDVANDGCGVGFGFGVGGVEGVGIGVELTEDVIHGAAFAAVAFVDFGFDEVVGGDDDDDFATEGEAEVFDGLRIEGVNESDVEALFVEVDGEGAVEARGSGGEEVEEGVGGSPVAEVNKGDAEFGSDDGPDVFFGLDDLEVCEEFGHGFPAIFDFREDFLRKRGIDEVTRLEDFQELSVVHFVRGLEVDDEFGRINRNRPWWRGQLHLRR